MDYIQSLEKFSRKLEPIKRKLETYGKPNDNVMLRRKSVWPTKEMAEIMAIYSEDYIAGMTTEERQKYDENQKLKEQQIQNMGFEDKVNEMFKEARKEFE